MRKKQLIGRWELLFIGGGLLVLLGGYLAFVPTLVTIAGVVTAAYAYQRS